MSSLLKPVRVDSGYPTLTQLRNYYKDRLDRGVISDLGKLTIELQLSAFGRQNTLLKGGDIYFYDRNHVVQKESIYFEYEYLP